MCGQSAIFGDGLPLPGSAFTYARIPSSIKPLFRQELFHQSSFKSQSIVSSFQLLVGKDFFHQSRYYLITVLFNNPPSNYISLFHRSGPSGFHLSNVLYINPVSTDQITSWSNQLLFQIERALYTCMQDSDGAGSDRGVADPGSCGLESNAQWVSESNCRRETKNSLDVFRSLQVQTTK